MSAAFSLFILTLVGPVANAAEYDVLWIDPGQSRDVYWSVNLSGKVYVSADADGFPACLDYWWIVWPFGQVKELGQHCGRATFELPDIRDFAVGGKLVAGNASRRTRVMGTASEKVSNTFPISF